MENLTLRDLNAARAKRLIDGKEVPSPLDAIMQELYNTQDKALLNLAESRRPLYEKLRSASPTERLRDRVNGKARGLDQVSGAAPPSGTWSVDRVIVDEIKDAGRV